MRNDTRSRRSRLGPPVRRATLASVLTVAIVAGLGAAETASATDMVKTKIDKGTLTVTGTGEGESLTLNEAAARQRS
jgi:hypothetical protein